MSSNARPEAADDGGIEVPAQHIVSPELRRKLQQCYDHGKRLLSQEKRDFDYVNTLFTECVVKDPSNLVYVEAFLDNLQDKYKNNKRGARGLVLGGPRGEFKKAISKKNWVEALRLGPELLKGNPWDVPTLRSIAQACEAFHYNEVELRYLKNALDANPKDVDVNRHCAYSLARMGQFEQAIACWHRIEELTPKDKEAPKKIAELQIERTRPQAGFGPAPTRRVSPSNAAATSTATASTGTNAEAATKETSAPQKETDSSANVASKKREIQLTPVQRLEKAISDDPTMIDYYLELIDLHVAANRFPEADRVFTRAQSASPGDPDVLAKGEDLAILKVQNQLKIAEQQAVNEGTEAARELAERLRENLHRTELEIYDARSQRFPEDASLKHRVGLLLKRMGNYREAAQRFQESRNSPEYYLTATVELGECLQHLKQYVKALHCYERAAEKSEGQDTALDVQKLALYRAGVLATGMKEWETAERTLSKLVALDAGYKDSRARLDKLRQISDKN